MKVRVKKRATVKCFYINSLQQGYAMIYKRIFFTALFAVFATIQVIGQIEKPNLLFIMTDQQQYNALGKAGNTIINTPNLDRLAEDGVFFTNFYSGSPVCVPARGIILTGRSIHASGIIENSIASDKYITGEEGFHKMKTFDDILIGQGYSGEYHGKWHCPEAMADNYSNRPIVFGKYIQFYRDYLAKENIPSKIEKQPGDQVDGLSRLPYMPNPMDYRYGEEKNWIPPYLKSGSYNNPTVFGMTRIPDSHTLPAFDAKNTIAALERNKNNPFTITCSFIWPHPPTITSSTWYEKYDADDMPIPESFEDDMKNSPYRNRWSQPEKEHARDRDKIKHYISTYYAMVEEVDFWVGEILDKLEELGLADNTMVVFTSDHGEMLGTHGMISKMNFYEESAHVPLIIRYPKGIKKNTVVDMPCSHYDLFPTIMDYLEAGQHPSHGQSLRSAIENTPGAKEAFKYTVAEWDWQSEPNYMVRSGDWKFLFGKTPESPGMDALYNLRSDPYEMNNLLGNNPQGYKYREKAEELKGYLLEWLERVESPYLQGVKDREIKTL